MACYDLLTREEGRSWTLATAIEGAKDRLAPILMTTLATALGLLPLATRRLTEHGDAASLARVELPRPAVRQTN
jgi:multidrug efflux pump subunit AcrB